MNSAEHKQLVEYINEMESAINKFHQTNDPMELYDISTEVEVLYGKQIDNLSDVFEMMGQQSGLAERNAKTILALLKKYEISDVSKMKIDNAFLAYASEILGETKKGLSGPDIVKYSNSFAVKYNVEIPINSSYFGGFGSIVPNKRTALLRNLQAFNSQQQFYIIKELSELTIFKNNEDVKELKIQLLKLYGHLAGERLSETDLIIKTKHWLAKYADSLKQYENALEKFESGVFKRNTLDDMRLSFELLVKDLLGNKKSLENQLSDLGAQLKDKGASEELRNMVVKIIEYYTKYQNSHVKHNDAVNSDEIEYVIELTSVVMKYLVKVLGGNN